MDETLKYPRTPHVEGSCLQLGDDKARVPLKKLRGAFTVWEEKLDGANSAIRLDSEGRLILQSRGHVLSGGGKEGQFAPLKAWAAAHRDELWGLLGSRYVLYGEFCFALHSAFYNQLDHFFYEFDALDLKSGSFLSTADRHDLLMGASFPSVPLVYAGPSLLEPKRIEALIKPSLFKNADWKAALRIAAERSGERDIEALMAKIDDTALCEGLYGKLETAEKTIGRVKFVRSGFVQAMLSHDEHWSERVLVPNGLSALGAAQVNGYGPHPSRASCLWSPADLRAMGAQADFQSEALFWEIAAGAVKSKPSAKRAPAQR